MQLQDSDIISAARDLCDEQNVVLNVAPNPMKRRVAPTPLWWTATAAAVITAFFVGKSLPIGSTPTIPAKEGAITVVNESVSNSGQVTAPSLIERDGGESSVVHDTIYKTRIVRIPVSSSQQQIAQADTSHSPGCSMLCDDIRYDLLAGN